METASARDWTLSLLHDGMAVRLYGAPRRAELVRKSACFERALYPPHLWASNFP